MKTISCFSKCKIPVHRLKNLHSSPFCAILSVCKGVNGLSMEKEREKIWNVPNVLTMIRLLLIPVYWVLMSRDYYYPALAVYVVASLTDLADGYIARKYNQITNFGKLMDPLADKLLVCSGMICLIALDRIPSWIVCIIVAREFVISGFRLIAAEQGIVIAASYWGKFKTTFQMIMVILMIMNVSVLQPLTTLIMWIATILTVISLVDYVAKNKDVLKDVD